MMPVGLLRNRRGRRAVLLLAVVAMLAVLWRQSTDRYFSGYGAVGSDDFVQYWAAGRLVLRGENPYDPEALFATEQAVGMPRPEAIRMWNPPWTLAVVLPVAALPFSVAIATWLLFQVGLLLGSGMLLWAFYAPGDGRHWIGALLATAFVPGWYALYAGQISPWLLAGAVLFLWSQRRGLDLLAGAGLALLMIKPHVTYLFWFSALWWIWQTRRWRVLTGWLAALAGATAVGMLFAPGILADYLVAASKPPLDWATPTLGGWLRLLLGIERRWLQFLPSVLGGVAWLAWLWRRQGPWHWESLAGPLLLVSVPTAVYGWSYDTLVLLVPVIDLVSWARQAPGQRGVAVLVALGILQILLVVQNLNQPDNLFKVWQPLALAGLYWWAVRHDLEQDKVAAQEGRSG
jgi:hypothetical protein